MRITQTRKGLYHVDGKDVVSVTTILGILDKPWMGPWVAKLAAESIIEGIKSDPDFRFHSDEEIETLAKKWARAYETKRKRAADFGSQVHNAVEAFYKEW